MDGDHGIEMLTRKMDAFIDSLHHAQLESAARFTRIESTLEHVVATLREASEAHSELRDTDLSLASRLTLLEANVKNDHDQSIGYKDIVSWAIGSGGIVAVGALIYMVTTGG